MSASMPCFTGDLTAPEQRFLAAMQEVGFGRFEYVQIRNGEIVVDPWPAVVQDVKFGAVPTAERTTCPDCQLKRQVVEFFAYTRGIDSGEIRTLEFRHGLPFSMEVELAVQGHGGRLCP